MTLAKVQEILSWSLVVYNDLSKIAETLRYCCSAVQPAEPFGCLDHLLSLS